MAAPAQLAFSSPPTIFNPPVSLTPAAAMSESQSYAHAFEAYNNEFAKQQGGFDFFSFHSPSDVAAPHPDLFESDIDSNLAAFPDLQLLTVDSYDPYFFRSSEKPQWQSPPSAITVSSDTQDSLSSYSLSLYNEQNTTQVNNAQPFPFDHLSMSFQQARIGSDYDAVPPSMGIIEDDPTSFGPLPPTPPQSPPVKHYDTKPYSARSTYSDYIPHQRRGSTTSSDYYSHSSYSPSHPTVSPIHISTQLPAVATVAPQPAEEIRGDPRKKYKCPSCPRGTCEILMSFPFVYSYCLS